MMAAAPSRTIAEGPPCRQPRGWSCDGSNWLFFDRACSRRKLHKHNHHPMIAAQLWKVCHHQSKRSNSRSTVSPWPGQKQRPTGVEIGGNIGGQPIRRRRVMVGPPPIPPAVYGYYAFAAMPARETQAGEAWAYLRPQPRSFYGHRFGHSFARTENERMFANATKIAEFSRIIRRRTTFGTRGSQVQILPLRPRLS
jgi:hypothetical protein